MIFRTISFLMVFVLTGFLLSAQGLKIEPGTCIKVETGTTLDMSGGDLYIESDATGDASLIDLGAVSYTGGGEAYVQRYLTNGKWHLISSPVASAVSGMFEDDYLQYHSENTNGWTDITPLNTPLPASKGYALWTVDGAATTEVFAGTTNSGTKDFDFTLSDLPDEDNEGWNLVGNPYPSSIDWDEVSKPANLSGAIWLFDPTVGDNGDYKYYISGGGVANTTTQYIPSGQGFFVRATGGDGTLSFQNDDRTHGGQSFYKSGNENPMLLLKTSGNNITTQTAIRFLAEATAQVDRLYDVNKIITNSTNVPNVYSKCEGERMAINSLPSIEGHETIPLYFEAGTNGIYRFTASELQSLPADVPVFLEDVANNFKQDLRANPEYNFNYQEGSPKLFFVHFKNETDIDERTQQTEIANCYLHNNSLHIGFAEPLTTDAQIYVYNAAGQCVLQTETRQTNNNISLNGSAAVYFVHIRSNNQVFSNKVVKL